MNCYLVGTGNRDLNSPLNWSSTSGGTPADVLGSELIGVLDLNNWTNINIVSKTQTSFITSNSGGLKKTLVTIGKTYKCTIEGETTVSNFRVMDDSVSANYYIKVGSGAINTTFYFTATNDSVIYFRNNEAGTTTITLFTLEEVLSVPNSSNPAIIDANSSIANGDVLSLSAQFDCGGFDCSAAAYTFTLSNAAYAFNVYGDLKDSTKRTNGFSSTGYLYFKGSSNIYSNGATQGWNRIYFDAVGATFTNQDDWYIPGLDLYLFNGTWNTNGKTISITGMFISQTGARTLILGNSIFNAGNGIYFSTSITLLENTATIKVTGDWFIGGGKTWYNIELNKSGSMGGEVQNFTCNNLTRSSGANIAANLPISGNITVNDTLTLTGNNAQNYRLLVASYTIGTPRTITVNGSIVASNVDFRDITLAGTANRDLSAISGGSGDCGGNSGITFTPSQTQYYKHTLGACQWSDETKWVTSSGGSTQGRVPLPQDDPVFDANSFTGASTLSVNCPRIGRSLNMEGVNQAVNFALANDIECYGSYVLGNNITQSGDYIAGLMGRSAFNLDVYGKTVYEIDFIAFGGTYTYQSNLKISNMIRCYYGNIYFNGYNITLPRLLIFNTGAVIHFGSGIIECKNIAGEDLFYNIATSEKIFCDTSTILLSPVSGNINYAYGFVGGSCIFNKVVISGTHTGNFDISGNNTFAELIIDKGRKVRFTEGSTQTINKFTDNGTVAEPITISSTNTTPATLYYSGTSYQQLQHANISYLAATPSNKWYAGLGSTDGGNNTGWLWRGYSSLATMNVKQVIKNEDTTGWYGVSWDESNPTTTMTRTGNMQLHRDLPVQSRMLGCLVSDAGSVTYLPADTWTGATLDGSAGQVMVEIPQHYRYFPPATGTVHECRISSYAIPGYTLIPKSYISAFEATVARSTTKLSSVVNATTEYRGGNNSATNDANSNTLLGKPATVLSRAQFRTYARNRGAGWEMLDYQTYNTLFWLYFVEYANTNSQAAVNSNTDANGFKQGGLGIGVTNVNGTDWNTFNAYYPIVNCGASNSLGNGSGEVSYTVPFTVPVTTKVNRYRGIENPFGHIWKNCDGIIFDIKTDADGGTSNIYICSTPSNYSDSITANYALIGQIPRTNGYIKALQSGSFLPLEIGGGSTTYWCDYFYQSIASSSLRTLILGGFANNGSAAGLCDSYAHYSVASADTYIGSRLCFFPQ